jgi:hypothetical protein
MSFCRNKRLKETVIKAGIIPRKGGDMSELTVIRNRAVQTGDFWPDLNTASINHLKGQGRREREMGKIE